MKIILVITLITFMSGCTSLQPIDMQASELQYQIKTNNIVNVGDEIEVLTADGKNQEFEIINITETQIVGKNVVVSIKDIVSVKKRGFSAVKNISLVAVIVGVAWIASGSYKLCYTIGC